MTGVKPMDDRTQLARSNAGMRLVAQMTFFNKAEFDRLHGFISESYTEQALTDQPAADRLAVLQALSQTAGKLRVYQVLAIDKHKAVVLMQAQADESFQYVELAVEEDYPHKISQFTLERMIEAPSASPDENKDLDV